MSRLPRRVVVVAVVAIIVLSLSWLRYVTNSVSLYDEVGITLNSWMPAPIRQWGCDQLQANFPGALPPHGCSTGDGTSWL
ncbi:hypothetical protein [Devosia beringensis]|uniref:hypothetical protein n=1 Tax=Devosia beringensis TaxID=2657486 RepID=UPI00186B867E|nr:hypothetical protein [Devosia beringensis]